MTDNRPAPLTTPDIDVSDLEGFILDCDKLISSELVALSNGDEFKAAVLLWSRAFKQSPPGSLPNDDRILASFSGAGAKWKKVKHMALRGFIECSDGRLYHPVLCKDIRRAAAHMEEVRLEKGGDLERKRKEREDRSRLFAQLAAAGVTPRWNTPTRDLRRLVTEKVTTPVTEKPPPVTPPVTVTVTAKHSISKAEQSKEAEAVEPYDPRAKLLLLCDILRKSPATHAGIIKKWPEELGILLGEGMDFEAHIVPAAREAAARGVDVKSLNYLRSRAGELRNATALERARANGQAHAERHRWLAVYGIPTDDEGQAKGFGQAGDHGWRWIRNDSSNGHWEDAHGVGAPPHDPRTLVTEEELARYPGAKAKRDELRSRGTT